MDYHPLSPTGLSKDRKVAGGIRRAYILALTIIATVTVGVYIIERKSVAHFYEMSELIHLSGKQRSTAQSLAKMAESAMTAANKEARTASEDTLKVFRDRMEEVHGELAAHIGNLRSEGRASADIIKTFYESPHNANAQIRSFIAAADRLLSSEGGDRQVANNEIQFAWTATLPYALDMLVKRAGENSAAQIRKTENVHAAMLVLILLILTAELLFIFRPLARIVERKTIELEQAHAEANHTALHDELTGLPNRRLLTEILETTLSQSRRNGRPAVICHIDLDYFKQINDTLGHAVGDEVLRRASDVLRDSTRESDFIARVGGDEFVIVDCLLGPTEGVQVMANRIVERMSQPMNIDGHICQIGASAGIATYEFVDDTIDTLMARADIALYHAKTLGRGQVGIYSDEAQTSFEKRLSEAA